MEGQNNYFLKGSTEEVTSELLSDSNRLKSMGYTEEQVQKLRYDHVRSVCYSLLELAGEDEEKLIILEEGLKKLKRKLLEAVRSQKRDVEKLGSASGSSNSNRGLDHQSRPSSMRGRGKPMKVVTIKKFPVLPRTRRCRTCGEYDYHDSRNCYMKYSS